jgi:hypothetical protein
MVVMEVMDQTFIPIFICWFGNSIDAWMHRRMAAWPHRRIAIGL